MKTFFNLLKTDRKAKSSRQSSVQLQVEDLESRLVPASIGTKFAGLDFDGDYISGTHMQQGGWANSAKSFASFHSLFNSSRSWLDLSGDGVVNNTDANLAINYIMNKVKADYAPFKLSVFQKDQDDFQKYLTDSFKGDVSVMITGSTAAAHTAGGTFWGVAPSVNTGNTKDEIVFVFAGGSVDSSSFIGGNRAHNWLNQVARTVSHEMGHAFGLDHVVKTNADPITHEAMGTVNRDFKRDFVLQDQWYITGSNKSQNSHQHLMKSDILGESNNTWIQVLRPGELTIAGNSLGNKIYISETATSFIVTMDGKSTVVGKTSTDVNSLNPFDQKLSRVRVLGKGGDDYVYAYSNVVSRVYAYGGAGNDTIVGGSGSDYLYGEDGNDYIYGMKGNDYMRGGNGTDRLYGYDGNDYLYGDSGKDYLYGMNGNDYLDGGKDGVADYLNGGTGADRFKRELYLSWFTFKNRDLPADFNAAQGDTLV